MLVAAILPISLHCNTLYFTCYIYPDRHYSSYMYVKKRIDMHAKLSCPSVILAYLSQRFSDQMSTVCSRRFSLLFTFSFIVQNFKTLFMQIPLKFMKTFELCHILVVSPLKRGVRILVVS